MSDKDKLLSGRVAIVTSGGRGLGGAMALGLAEAGAHVIVTASRERSELEAVAAKAPKGAVIRPAGRARK